MAGNPRIVTHDATFLWDHVTQRLHRGQVIDVPAGSALEMAIGPDKLTPLFGHPPAGGVPHEPQKPAERETRGEAGQDDTPASRKTAAATKEAAPAAPAKDSGPESGTEPTEGRQF
jgi:hypothetical protein